MRALLLRPSHLPQLLVRSACPQHPKHPKHLPQLPAVLLVAHPHATLHARQGR